MKSNKILNKRYKPVKAGNYCDWGELLDISGKVWDESMHSKNLGSTSNSALSGITVGISGFQNAAKVSDTDSVWNDINSINNTRFGIGSFDNLANQAATFQPLTTPTVNDLTKSTWQQLGNMASTAGSMAATGATIGGPLGALVGGGLGLLSSGAGWITGNYKAKEEVNKLREEALLVEQARLNNFNNAVQATKNNQLRGMEMGYYACGGKMNKHSYGGNLTGDFTNDVTIIGNGGIHETNPYEGVPMGIDSEGTPNLVEEGEVIFNDYVYSNRLTLDKDMRDKYKVKNKKATYADVAKKLQKESEERPNDYISKNGLDAIMLDLALSQEKVRATKNTKEGNKFEIGGFKSEYYNPYIEVEGEDGSTQYVPEELGTKLMPISNEYTLDKFFGKKWHKNDAKQAINYYPDEYLDPKYWKYIKNPFRITFSPAHLGIFPAVGSGPTRSPKVVDITTDSPEYKRSQATEAFDKGEIDANEYAKRLKLINDSTADETIKQPSSSVYSDLLRYAPAIGSGLNTISDLLGFTNTPDYTNANKVRAAADNLTPIGYTPLHNYLRYEPVSKDYYTDKLNSVAGATRRNIINTSGGNRAAALAGLLANDYNTQTKLGDLAKSIEEANLARQQQVATFNRGTDQTNSELAIRAAIANSELDKLRLNSILQEVQLRDAELARASAGRTANLNSFLTNLGNIGVDIANRNDMRWMAEKGLLGHYSIEDYMRLGFDKTKATELHNKYYKNLKKED